MEVAGLKISDLRITFVVERQPDQTQVTGEANIYNLRPENEQRIIDRGDSIALYAGYPETIALVFMDSEASA